MSVAQHRANVAAWIGRETVECERVGSISLGADRDGDEERVTIYREPQTGDLVIVAERRDAGSDVWEQVEAERIEAAQARTLLGSVEDVIRTLRERETLPAAQPSEAPPP